LTELGGALLNLESRLQEWLVGDISVPDPALLVIGRELGTDFRGWIDILCIDVDGDLVIVELRRDKTPREVTAQALDYASW
jgi:RecB family endonuclease NucS